MIYAFGIFLFASLASSSHDIDFSYTKNTTSDNLFHENVLCRGCGNEITFSSSFISKTSPSAQYSYYDTLFKKDQVLVQVLISEFFLPHPVITTSLSKCVGITEWEEAESWFPGYRSKPCICPECGALVGWMFEPVTHNFVDKPAVFFSLILTNLIGESFLNSWTILPEDKLH